MAEYINKAELEKQIHCWNGFFIGVSALAIADLPTIDIVRCCECEHWIDEGCYSRKSVRRGELTGADFFCADGERKE